MQLAIQNLSKRYANGVQALDNVSLTIAPGMFGLLGPNGAGKGDEEEVRLYLRKHRIKGGETELKIEVAEKPVRAGIDPVVKLIDRRPDDNTVAVTQP